MNEQEFQGWTNRETWATALWISNDRGLYQQARDYVEGTIENHPLDGGESQSEALYCLEDSLRNWIEEELLTHENVRENQTLFSMLTDIGSLYRVNYREIADHYLSEKVLEKAGA